MSESYTKLFSSILSSSIWGEDDRTRLVWITMLALCDRHGEVGASVVGLARLAGVPLADCEAAIAKFLAPDPYSRTEANEGRRIEKIGGGWRLLNYEHYREARDLDERRAQDRERKRRQRERDVSRNVTEVPPASAQVDTDTDTDTESSPRRARNSISMPAGVSEQVWSDWLAHRRARKAPVTATVLATIAKQAALAKKSLDEVLTTMVTRGWTGYQASWEQQQTGFRGAPQGPARHVPNMPLGSPSCSCAECVAHRTKATKTTYNPNL